MKTILKIAILAFLLKHSVPGQKGLNLNRNEVSDMDWLTGLAAGNETEEFIRWFIAEKVVDTESISVKGKKLIQVWLPGQTVESMNYEFLYFIN